MDERVATAHPEPGYGYGGAVPAATPPSTCARATALEIARMYAMAEACTTSEETPCPAPVTRCPATTPGSLCITGPSGGPSSTTTDTSPRESPPPVVASTRYSRNLALIWVASWIARYMHSMVPSPD